MFYHVHVSIPHRSTLCRYNELTLLHRYPYILPKLILVHTMPECYIEERILPPVYCISQIPQPSSTLYHCSLAERSLKMSGIDISIIAAHSARGASLSAAAYLPVISSKQLTGVLNHFRKFYYCPTHNPMYG